MTCREVADFLADYLDDAMPLARKTAFVAHLAVCLTCRRYLTQYRATIKLARAAADAPLPPPPEDLIRAILASVALEPPAPHRNSS